MRLFLRRITSSDPTTFVATFGVWTLICGIALVIPGNIFEFSPTWNTLKEVYNKDSVWGWAMIANGAALIISVRLRKVPQRAAISAFTAVVWFILGSSMLIDGYRYGVFSIIGAYAVWGAICCIFAVEQWVNYPLGDSNGVR